MRKSVEHFEECGLMVIHGQMKTNYPLGRSFVFESAPFDNIPIRGSKFPLILQGCIDQARERFYYWGNASETRYRLHWINEVIRIADEYIQLEPEPYFFFYGAELDVNEYKNRSI